ncbi:hypothetical protein GIB67_022138 [Kingdonia uniflora]|uniref:Uncharacterized protein n=1 Tax=Kingdonia uniflora TaxID=39325 RepID=A0A7J7N8Z9_9MAGN|nr:hypothetical protein GIB67_022138 [Kingdonia uniflora]
MFAALPEDEKGALCTTCFVLLLLIDLITTISTLVMKIFDCHLDDVLRLNLLKIILSFLIRNKGRNVWVKYVNLRNHIEAPTIGTVPAIEPPVVGVPAIVGDSTRPLGDTPLLGQYQFSTPGKIAKRKREGGKGEWQKKLNANKKNKKAALEENVEGTKKEAFTDEQFDHVPLIQLKTKIPKKGMANRVPRKRRA